MHRDSSIFGNDLSLNYISIIILKAVGQPSCIAALFVKMAYRKSSNKPHIRISPPSNKPFIGV